MGQAGWIFRSDSFYWFLGLLRSVLPGGCVGPAPPSGGSWNNGQSHSNLAAQSEVHGELAGNAVWESTPDLLHQDLF